jgi:hypothetical protein
MTFALGRNITPANHGEEADFVVTGTLNPDVTGKYYLYGSHEGYPDYARPDLAYFIWINYDLHWEISDDPGSIDLMFDKGDSTIVGNYSPQGESTGTAKVTKVK